MKTKGETQNYYIEEIDNFDYMKKSPIIFFRYTIQMIMFLVSIYLVHLNFSIMNALWALVLLIVSEAVLEMIENAKYSKNANKITLFKKFTRYVDRNFHFVILLVSFAIRGYWYFKLDLGKENLKEYMYIISFLCASIIPVFIYLISKELFSKRTAQIAAIMYSIGVFTSTYCTVFTNYHIFAVLILFSIYLSAAKKYSKISYIGKNIVIGLVLGIATVIRIEGIIYLGSFVIYLFANSLIKNNNRKEKYIAICLIIGMFVLVNGMMLLVSKMTNSSYDVMSKLDKVIETFKDTDKSVEKFEINEAKYWNNSDYSFLNSKVNVNKFNKYDSAILLFCTINAAILVIYCKMKNIEDERMYLIYIIVLFNFFVFGFVRDNNSYSYVAKIMLYILAAGGLTIFKKNAEMEAREKYGIKLLTD